MISPRLSTYLDFLRFAAALVVLASHLAYARFTDGAYLFIREFNLGSDAVVVFFVLSGFVIAHTAKNKDHNLSQYFFNRATRIYSVAIPAILLTFIIDRYGASHNYHAYNGWWYNPATLGEMLAIGLSFCGEWNVNGFRLGTNGPYWSLSYEVAYYLLFAFAFYMRGVRRVAWLTIALLVIGPKIILLAPAWLMGVALYYLTAATLPICTKEIHEPCDDSDQPSRGNANFINWTAAITPIAAYMWFLYTDTPQQLLAFSQTVFSPDVISTLRFSDEFIWNAVVGLLFTIHLFGVSAMVRKGFPNAIASTSIKWLAGASFSLYLVHYPVIQCVDALLPASMSTPVRHFALLFLTVAACFTFAELFERRLKSFRTLCSRCFDAIGFAIRNRHESV